MSKILSPTVPDPFEVFHSVRRETRQLKLVIAILFSTALMSVGALVLVTSRPPVVIFRDNLAGVPPQIIRQGDVPVTTEYQARVFFLDMIRLRSGWDSMTVDHDLSLYSKSCHPDQAAFERAYQDELVVSQKNRSGESFPRKVMWARSEIRNTLILPESIDDVQCKWDPEQSWNCLMRAKVATQNLFPPYLKQPPLRSSMFVATLLPVPFTIDTPYGLLVGVMREIPDESKESTP